MEQIYIKTEIGKILDISFGIDLRYSTWGSITALARVYLMFCLIDMECYNKLLDMAYENSGNNTKHYNLSMNL